MTVRNLLNCSTGRSWIATLLTLALILAISGIVLALYQLQFAYSAELSSAPMSSSNKSLMTDQSYHDLDGSTRNFLAAIERADALYNSPTVLLTEENHVREQLRAAFGHYFTVLLETEENYGLAATDRSREVVEEAIGDFMETQDTSDGSYAPIADDLDAYSKVMTETLIREAILTV